MWVRARRLPLNGTAIRLLMLIIPPDPDGAEMTKALVGNEASALMSPVASSTARMFCGVST